MEATRGETVVGGLVEAVAANVTAETVHEVATDQLEPAKGAKDAGERGTVYVILAGIPEDEDGGGAPAWYTEGERRATSPGAAIRAWLADNTPDETGLYVAVPARSWNPQRVEVVTRTALRLGAA